MVFRRGVLRSMSRSGGVLAQEQVGEGQVGVVGMVSWRRVREVESWRRERGRMHGAGARESRANVKDIVVGRCEWARRVGDLFNGFGMVPGDDDDGVGDSGARWLGREVHQVWSGPCEMGFYVTISDHGFF